MSTGCRRSSERISQLDKEKAQKPEPRKSVATIEDLGSEEERVNLKRKRNHINTKYIQDQATTSGRDELPNISADKISDDTLPDKSKLQLLLNRLKKRDRHNLFAKPVNPNEAVGYYEIIKKPMDYKTISTKLEGGRYRTLAEFEADVNLVHQNAMYFNSATTIYYIQAMYIRDLAQKLFSFLKTDPAKFQHEVSDTRERADPKEAGVETSKFSTRGDQPIENIELQGEEERPDEDEERNEFETNCYWDSFINNESFMSLLYKNPGPEIETEVGYKVQMMQFVKTLGPKAQMIVDDTKQSSTEFEDGTVSRSTILRPFDLNM